VTAQAVNPLMGSSEHDEFLYRGHRILVEAHERSTGHWVWRYRVEGKVPSSREGDETLADAATALQIALATAMLEVEASYRAYVPSGWGSM
jgi:hypothetical protein